jgi:tetratricopeptide (TPR) repeat protein
MPKFSGHGARAEEAGGTIVAVFDIEDTRAPGARLSDRERADLTVYLGAILAEGAAFRVVPPEQLKKALEEKKRQSHRPCFDERCQIEIGREVAAQKTLATRIMKVGQHCGIVATLYDLRQAVSERATTYKGACDKDALFSGVEFLAKKLRGAGAEGAPADPAAATKHYQEGLAALERNDPDAAERSFAAAEKAGYADWRRQNDLYHQWGELYRTRKKDPARAAEKFERCVQVSQDKTEWPAYWCIYLLGVLAYDQGRAPEAVEKFEQALAFMASASWAFKNDVFHMLGETYRLHLGDAARAAEFHQRAVEVSQDRSDWPAYWSEYVLGLLVLEKDQPDRAIAWLQQSLADAPDMVWNLKNDVFHMLAEIYRIHKGDKVRAAEYHQKAFDISQDKSDWPAFWSEYLLGVLAYEQKQPDRAIELFQASLAHAQGMDWTLKNDILHMLGETYRNEKGDAKLAAEFHQKAWDVSADKSDWPAFWSRYVLGWMAYQQGNADRAIELCQEALSQMERTRWYPPGISDWQLQNDILHVLGEVYRTQKNNPDRAAEFHQRAWDISRDKADWPAFWSRYILGVMDFERGDGDRAVERFASLRDGFPRIEWIFQNDILYYWAESYRVLKKDSQKAGPLYQECLRVSQELSDWPAFWCLLRQAVIARDAGRKGEAAEMMLRAEVAGKSDDVFLKEIDRVMRASGMR